MQASSVAEEVLKTEYDSVRLLYNSFKSAISFKPTICTILSPETLEKSDVIADKMDQYELEGTDRAEMLQDLAEFQLASMMFYAMNEACTSEHASRMQVRAVATFGAIALQPARCSLWHSIWHLFGTLFVQTLLAICLALSRRGLQTAYI